MTGGDALASPPGSRPAGRRGDPYAGIPGRRIFVAAPLTEEASERVRALVTEVRAAGPRPNHRDVRWVRLDGLHVTLRFIGPTPEARLADAAAAVAATAATGGPFEVALHGAGAFPAEARPRAIWLGIATGAGELSRLTTDLDAQLAARGWPADDRPFRPHLTLARSDGIGSGADIARRLIAASGDLDIRWTVDRLVLFESVTGGGPARYVPRYAVPLGT